MDRKTKFLLDLLTHHGGDLHRLLVRLTLREDVAEDLLQELFLRLQRGPDLMDLQTPIAYAKRTAIHLAFDWRRGESRRKARLETIGHESVQREKPPGEQLLVRDQVEQTLRLLEQLPELYRECLLLRHFHDEDYLAIAEQVGKTEHQVRAICSKATKQLRELWQAEEEA